MNNLSIFSYSLVGLVLVLNAFKGISNKYKSYIYHAIVLLSLGGISYFIKIENHKLFIFVIVFFYTSMYTTFLNNKSNEDQSNLFVSIGQFIIPIYLLVSKTIWESLIFIIILGILRVLSSYKANKNGIKNTLVNIVELNHRFFLLLITYLLIYFILGTCVINLKNYHLDNIYIVLPLMLLYLVSFVYSGGIGSKTLEISNLESYRSKNIIAYTLIYQFLIPLVLLMQIKFILGYLAFDIYQFFIRCILFLSFGIMSVIFWRFKKTNDQKYRLNLLKNLNYVPLAIIFLFSETLTILNFSLHGIVLSLGLCLCMLAEHYNITFKRYIFIGSLVLCFINPFNPMFYFIIQDINLIESTNKDYISILIILTLLISSILIKTIINVEKDKKNNKHNKYVNYRAIYIVLGLVVGISKLVYDKV